MNHTHSEPYIKLALSATLHCLTGCGLGDVIGMTIGLTIGFSYYESIFTGIIFGSILGYIFGIFPLLKRQIDLQKATKIVLTTELISIVFMELGEAITEVFSPGMRKAGPLHESYWIGLLFVLLVGFLAALPVNLFLVRKGIRHQH